MIKKHKYDILILFAILGLGVSFYLTVTHYMGFTVPCTITHGCETVLSSKYSKLFGIPLSLWGTAYFTSVIVTTLLANHYKIWKKLLTILLGIGALMSLSFLGLQFFVIKKVCQYCLVTDLTSILLFILDLNISKKDEDYFLPKM